MVNIPKQHKAAVVEEVGKGLKVKTVDTPEPKDSVSRFGP